MKTQQPAPPSSDGVTPATFHYDPPYERPLEDELIWHLAKYLADLISLDYQHRIRTPAGVHFLDFVLTCANRLRVGLEINPPEEDDDRLTCAHARSDALTISSGAVDVLYRFRAYDLLCRPHDALMLMSRWSPSLFHARGRSNLVTLSSEEARRVMPQPHQTEVVVCYSKLPDIRVVENVLPTVPTTLRLRRFARTNPDAWMRHYDEALLHVSTQPTPP